MDAVTIHVGKEPRYSMHKTCIINLKSYLQRLSETTINHKVFFKPIFARLEYIPCYKGDTFRLIRPELSGIQQVVERQPLFSWSQK
jgi:hypothetical protein